MKILKSAIVGLLFITSCPVYASTLWLYDLGTIDVYYPDGVSTVYSGATTSGSLTYSGGTGTGDITAIDNSYTSPAEMFLHDLTLSANADGSVHMEGLFDVLTSTDNAVMADLVFDYSYDPLDDVTTYNIWTLDSDNDGIAGTQMTSGVYAGLNLDFNATIHFLAYVENDFPVYSPVPAPAAVWLFGSGLIALAGYARRRRHG